MKIISRTTPNATAHAASNATYSSLLLFSQMCAANMSIVFLYTSNIRHDASQSL